MTEMWRSRMSTAVNNAKYAAKEEQKKLQARIDELENVCAELYQVIGVLADEAGRFSDGSVIKALDNASQLKMVHSDVLPFPCKNLEQV